MHLPKTDKKWLNKKMMTIFRSIFCPKKKDENGICRDCYPKKNLEKRRKSQDIAKKII